MEPAIRKDLNKMRDDAYIEIEKNGYIDPGPPATSASIPSPMPPIPRPRPKKKRNGTTRFRETPHFRAKTMRPSRSRKRRRRRRRLRSRRNWQARSPGKKEKSRYGQAPTKTLPNEPQIPTEDAGAGSQVAQADPPDNLTIERLRPPSGKPASPIAPVSSVRKKSEKKGQPTPPKTDAPAPVAARCRRGRRPADPVRSLGSWRHFQKKKAATTTGEKTHHSDRKKKPPQQDTEPPQPTPSPRSRERPRPNPPHQAAPAALEQHSSSTQVSAAGFASRSGGFMLTETR